EEVATRVCTAVAVRRVPNRWSGQAGRSGRLPAEVGLRSSVVLDQDGLRVVRLFGATGYSDGGAGGCRGEHRFRARCWSTGRTGAGWPGARHTRTHLGAGAPRVEGAGAPSLV